MCFFKIFLSNISIVEISVGVPVAVNNSVPASQVGFQQFSGDSIEWKNPGYTGGPRKKEGWPT